MTILGPLQPRLAVVFSLARLSTATLAVMLALSCFPPAYANAKEGFNRKGALAGMDRNVERVRKMMNGDTEELERLLIWYMANPAGDHPKILAVCSEIIEKSTKPANVLVAVHGVGGAIDAHSRYNSLTGRRKTEIAVALRRALIYKNQRVQFAAAYMMKRLGGKYKDEAFKFYLAYLSNPVDEPDAKRLRRDYIDAIRELVKFNRPEAAEEVRRITEKNDLLTFYETEHRNIENEVVKAENQEFVEQWKAFISSGGTEK